MHNFGSQSPDTSIRAITHFPNEEPKFQTQFRTEVLFLLFHQFGQSLSKLLPIASGEGASDSGQARERGSMIATA